MGENVIPPWLKGAITIPFKKEDDAFDHGKRTTDTIIICYDIYNSMNM